MTYRSKIVEVMAAAICGAGTPCEACRNSAERALSALHAEGLAVVPGWQPIESAPKDGTPFLAWNSAVVFVAAWSRANDARGGWIVQAAGRDAISQMDEQGVDYLEPGFLAGLELPTYWMPLPAPPTNSTKEESDE